MTKLLTSGILFSTAVNAELIAKPAILDSLLSISVTLAFKSAFLTSSLVSEIFFPKSDLSVSCVVFKRNLVVSMLLTFLTSLSYTVFLTTSFLLYHLVYLSQQEQVLMYQYLVYLLQFLN